METTAVHPRGSSRPEPTDRPLARALTRALLACGVLYGAVYVFANDVAAARFDAGYSRLHQAVSELSATGAPAQGFLRAMLPVLSALMLAFGVGVWRASRESRALKVTGGLLLASTVVGVAWLWFPMTSRENMAGGPMPANDVGHLVLSGVTVALILAEMAFSAAAFGRWFRLFAALAALTMLVFGVLTSAVAAGLASGQGTAWMGLYERISLGAWLAWMAALAVLLLRTRTASARSTP